LKETGNVWIGNPITLKVAALKRMGIDEDSYPQDSCFCCEYVTGFLSCTDCPIEWGEDSTCGSAGSLYMNFMRHPSIESAEQIIKLADEALLRLK
jgi:hypothetical protein